MKETLNRGYPYPECAPPYVKDLGDLPGQLKALAEAVDTDLDVAQAAALAALDPPGVDLVRTSAQVLSAGQALSLDTIRFNNDNMADTPNSRLVVRTPGLFLVTGSCNTTAVTTDFLNLTIRVGGVAVRTNGTNPNSAAGTAGEQTVSEMLLLSVGQVLTLTQSFSGGGTTTYQFAHLAAVLVARLS